MRGATKLQKAVIGLYAFGLLTLIAPIAILLSSLVAILASHQRNPIDNHRRIGATQFALALISGYRTNLVLVLIDN